MTLDSDTVQLIRKRMRERGISFKAALNQAVREGLAPRSEKAKFSTPTFDMGASQVNLDRALRLAAELEDEELIRKQRLGK